MRGDLVVVKDVSNNPLILRVWETVPAGVYAHSEEEWNKRLRGDPHLEPVGFPREDVYCFEDDIEGGGAVDWNTLRHYIA